MKNNALLNNIEHKDLKVITRFSSQYGDNIASTLTFPSEFSNVQKEYPILFRKDPETEKYQSTVLFGLQKSENLFLDDNAANGWNASYIPAIMARGPFLIGFQNKQINGLEEQVPVVHVDMDNPRVSMTDGKSVFKEHGGNSPYLEYVSSVLKGIHSGMAVSDDMFAAFNELELIEPLSIEIELNNGDMHQLTGNYTISEKKLAALSGDDLERLNKAGYLQGAFLVISSLTNIQKLIDIKNSRL